jgi:hypothetical protein
MTITLSAMDPLVMKIFETLRVGGRGLLRDHPLAGLQPALRALDLRREWRQLHRTWVGGPLDEPLEPGAALLEGEVEQLLVPLREQVERAEDRRGLLGEHVDARLGGVDAVLERVEHLGAIGSQNHELAVEHETPLGKLQLREIAAQRLPVPRLNEDLRAVHEGQRPEPVVLRFVRPLIALGQLLSGQRELRLHGRRERQGHGAIVAAPRPEGGAG